MVSTKYLAMRYLEDMRDDPKWAASVMQKRVSRECGADIHISKCYRARQFANKIILGDTKNQYKRLYDYAATIEKTNPGCLVKIKTSLMV